MRRIANARLARRRCDAHADIERIAVEILDAVAPAGTSANWTSSSGSRAVPPR